LRRVEVRDELLVGDFRFDLAGGPSVLGGDVLVGADESELGIVVCTAAASAMTTKGLAARQTSWTAARSSSS
jgi:hypothetical protein